jgi:predicted Ser/Thr protein kinase
MSTAPPLPAACAARYRIERRLAHGGFGTVYLARHLELDRPVALKLLHRDVLKDAEMCERFLSEAKIAASLAHPNIVIVLDHGRDDGVPWIVYEYVEGTSLREVLAKGAVRWRDAVLWSQQVVSALACAHAAGVIHRDVKPENVLLTADGVAKVTDFGTARWHSGSEVRTAAGVILGTPHYLAPELITGGAPTPQSDFYAVGVMLFELVTGRPPFTDDSLAEMLRAHVQRDPPRAEELVPDLPGSVQEVLDTALAKAPRDRYLSAAAFGQALASAVADRPSMVEAMRRTQAAYEPADRPVTLASPAPLFPRRWPAALLALLTLAGAALIAWRPKEIQWGPPPRQVPAPLPADFEATLEDIADGFDRRGGDEARMWDYLGRSPLHADPEKGAQLARELDAACRKDQERVEVWRERLSGGDHLQRAAQARLAALAVRLACRRAYCDIAFDIAKYDVSNIIDSAQQAQTRQFPADMLLRVGQYQALVADALETAARTPGQLDRNHARMLGSVWTVWNMLGREVSHFDPAQMKARREKAQAELERRLAGTPYAALAGLVERLASVWALNRADGRRDALVAAKAQLADFKKSAPEPATFHEELGRFLDARIASQN